eukprot:2443919-Ditylum_brightwellii.AAC.1
MPKRSPRKKQGSSLPISPKVEKERMLWERKFDELCAFKAQNGHCNVSTHDERNKSLGIWVSHQRVAYKKNALNSDRIQRMDSIGFIWDMRELSYAHAWNEQFEQLCAFKAHNGHCNVSQKDAPNKSLGIWVFHQRGAYKKNTLNSDRIQQLNSIGFVWDPHEHSWNAHFHRLCAFKAQNGHYN